jgi:hypothetical protein
MKDEARRWGAVAQALERILCGEIRRREGARSSQFTAQ